MCYIINLTKISIGGGMEMKYSFESQEKALRYLIKNEPHDIEKFENLYNVDDLFIGNVSLIGIYKDKMKINGLKNSFEFFQELGQDSEPDLDSEVHDSQYSSAPVAVKLKSEDDKADYNYIDLLAIVQVIKSDNSELEGTRKKASKRVGK